MSDVVEQKRTLDDVKKDFHSICYKTGQIQYQMYALSKDLELFNKQLIDLNLEAGKLEAAAKQEKSNG